MEQLVEALGGRAEKDSKASQLSILDADKDTKLAATLKAIKKGEKPIVTSIFLILDGILKQNLKYDDYLL
jgi:hypothetical protein